MTQFRAKVWGLPVLLALAAVGADGQGTIVTGSAPAILDRLAPAWLAAYASAGQGGVAIPAPFGPPQGKLDPNLAAFLDGRSAFALLTREIAEADLATFRARHRDEPVIVPVAKGSWNRFGFVDPVVVIVNRANPIRALTFLQLDAVLSATRWRGGAPIADWAALGVKAWRARPVHVVGGDAWASEESARALTIRRRVLSVGGRVGRWRKFAGSGSEAEVVRRVAADPDAIGFTGAGHLAPGVRAVAIAHDGRPVLPTRDAVTSGAYPLARMIDLVMARDAQGCIPQPVAAFARFLVSDAGQAVVRRDGVFLPLDARERQGARRVLSAPCRRTASIGM